MKFDCSQQLILENDRVLLRPMEAGDVALLKNVALADPTLLQFSPQRVHTEEYLAEYVSIALRDRENNTRYAFTIFDKQTQTFAGSTSFGNISNYDKRIEIGWTWIGRQFQRTGLNRQCKFLMLSYVFETLQFERLEFRTDERNSVSRTAIEKVGGKFEGILRSHMLMNDGWRRSTACYSILKDEWPALKIRMSGH